MKCVIMLSFPVYYSVSTLLLSCYYVVFATSLSRAT
uniref:Uncharacterized protein n=1 Tax=Anguilla anguilla TaxID=7936 RepID=A0A0E9S4E4_ANGAN